MRPFHDRRSPAPTAVPALCLLEWHLGTARYAVRPHEVYPAQTTYEAATPAKPEWQTLTWKAESGGREVGSVTLRVLTDSPGLPQ